MIYCLNPHCAGPKNPDHHRFCHSCGARLQLGDRYEAVYCVGEGRNSHTFVGRDRATLVGAQCLIKQFPPEGETVLARAQAAERFRREVEHLAIASRHAQIPDLFAYFERGEQQFLVQQFLVGPHLEQRLQDNLGPFDSDEVRAFLRNVLPILHHLHQHRLIHRDIKPSNFRRPPGQSDWWLVDFGAIKPVTATAMAQPGTLIGSADYAAPEQLRGAATYASDLYSLGVVCLHLLTGLQPFDLFDGVNGCWQWRSIVPDVAPSLAMLIDQMVQPALRDRCPDASTALASLGLPVSPPPVPAPQRQTKPLGWTATTATEWGRPSQDMVVIPATQSGLGLMADGSVTGRSLSSTAPSLLLQPPPQPITAIAAHPQQPIWVSGDRQGQLVRWELQRDRWQSHPLATLNEAIAHLLFTPEGDSLLVADESGDIHRWHWQPQQWQGVWRDHSAKVNCLAFSHDGTTLASGDSQGCLKLWDWPTQTLLRTLSQQPGAITAIAWLPDDEGLVTAGWDVTLRWRCPQTGGTFQVAKAAGFYLPVRSLLAHPTEPWVVAGSQDGQLQLWASSGQGHNAETGSAEIRQTATLNGAIVALSANGDRDFFCLTATGHLTQWTWPA